MTGSTGGGKRSGGRTAASRRNYSSDIVNIGGRAYWRNRSGIEIPLY